MFSSFFISSTPSAIVNSFLDRGAWTSASVENEYSSVDCHSWIQTIASLPLPTDHWSLAVLRPGGTQCLANQLAQQAPLFVLTTNARFFGHCDKGISWSGACI